MPPKSRLQIHATKKTPQREGGGSFKLSELIVSKELLHVPVQVLDATVDIPENVPQNDKMGRPAAAYFVIRTIFSEHGPIEIQSIHHYVHTFNRGAEMIHSVIEVLVQPRLRHWGQRGYAPRFRLGSAHWRLLGRFSHVCLRVKVLQPQFVWRIRRRHDGTCAMVGQ